MEGNADTACGSVIWITGLAASGKTTIAEKTVEELRKTHANIIHLDGDGMREVLKNEYLRPFGHSIEDRKATAYIYAKLASALAAQGMIVIVSTISLFHEIHDCNRAQAAANGTRYIEVLVETSEEERLRRTHEKNATNANHKNLYTHGTEVMGVHQQPELPREPALTLINDTHDDLDANVRRILDQVKQWQT